MSTIIGVLGAAILFAVFGLVQGRQRSGGGCGACDGACHGCSTNGHQGENHHVDP